MAGLTPLGRDLFVVDGPQVRDMGVRFTTRMAVARLRNGDVWVSSPVPLPYAVMTEIVQLGPVRYLVAATPRHHWRLNLWHELFPDAELWSSPITPVTLRQGDPLPLAGILGDRVPTPWAEDLDQVLIRGSKLLDEVAFFHEASRTLLLEDIIQIHPLLSGRPLRNAAIRLGGVAAPGGGVPRDIRLTYRDREAARQCVQRILDWPFDTLVVAHGPIVERHARQTVESAFAWVKN